MQYVIISFVIALFAACGSDGCECAGGSTIARKPEPYKGDPNATAPYLELGKLSVRAGDCQGNICDYALGLGPYVHHPLKQNIQVKITCKYYLDAQYIGVSKTTKWITLHGPVSRCFEGFDFIHGVEAGRSYAFGAECEAQFNQQYGTVRAKTTVRK
jgi:hypothetical protein